MTKLEQQTVYSSINGPIWYSNNLNEVYMQHSEDGGTCIMDPTSASSAAEMGKNQSCEKKACRFVCGRAELSHVTSQDVIHTSSSIENFFVPIVTIFRVICLQNAVFYYRHETTFSAVTL